jgi:hypothetical protein
MPLRTADREFRFPRVSHLDFKQVEMDRVLTSFLARLWHNGYPSRLLRQVDLTVGDFLNEFIALPQAFEGFDEHEDIARRWIETHLLDLVNRGRPTEAVAGLRPLHGFTYRFRNSRRSRPYGADQQLYELLAHARNDRGARALELLKDFFFEGVDKATQKVALDDRVDVETQALLSLADQVKQDIAETGRGSRDSYPPLCEGAADLLADDVLRILFYQRFMPRSVMVDYLKALFAFHLGLYHLRLLKLLPALVRRHAPDPTCGERRCPSISSAANPHLDCPYRVGLLLDVANRPGTRIAHLAEESADTWYRRIPPFVKANFTVKKLDEFAGYLVKTGKLSRPEGGFTVGDLLPLLEGLQRREREPYFKSRLAGVLEDSRGEERDLVPEVAQLVELGLPALDTYIEVLVAHRGDFHRRYIVECLDSLLLKNRPGAVLAQPRGRDARRRFVLDSRLLEVLLQIAVLREGGVYGFHSAPLRIDELLAFLRGRYGLHIDQLPIGDGFGPPSIQDRTALRANSAAFLRRLREIGFYRDLSDAYVTQTVTPRYVVPASDGDALTPAGGRR